MQAFKAINLFSLAALIGIELFLGIAVAKIIFYAPALTAESVFVDMFARGSLMSAIFVALGYVMIAISGLNLLYEFANLRENSNKMQKISKILLALLNLALSLLFFLYYTRQIVQTQEAIMQGLQGVEVLASAEFRAFHAQSERLVKVLEVLQAEFRAFHAQSERLVKVLVVLQMVLFFVSFRTPKPFAKDEHKAI